MGTKIAVQILGTAAVVAVLAWQCAATGGAPGPQGGIAGSASLLVRGEDPPRTQTAIVGARF